MLLGDFNAYADDETMKNFSFHSTCVMETGLSDFHRMIISMLKMHFRKLPPKVISYRDLKNFENERFMNSLQSAFNDQNSDYVQNLDLFFNICHEVLNKHAPRKIFKKDFLLKFTRVYPQFWNPSKYNLWIF